jgi:hypothetical protein
MIDFVGPLLEPRADTASGEAELEGGGVDASSPSATPGLGISLASLGIVSLLFVLRRRLA